MKQVILGTAGHIDHGKTSLIRAMTGIDTDRLKEEKLRGITIELGFAYVDLPNGDRLGIVDVPGHERFVRHMVAGATGIDMVALIIAADEGVMPQTREHMEICQLLRVKKGLVALTKIDLVDDPEWIEMVKEDVAEFLTGTFLEGAPIVPLSAATGEGMEEFKGVLTRLVESIEPRNADGPFRLPVDRVFSMRGFGTVVTGTSISGRLHIGAPVIVYPSGHKTKVRGIQVHNEEVEEVLPGQRTAVNLQSTERALIQRGHVVATPGALVPSHMVDVHLELLSSAPRVLKNRAKIRFHTGTSENLATLVLLNEDELKPGEKSFAQIRLDEPIAVLRGDRFVIRSYSPVLTIGGGSILHPLPHKHKGHDKRAAAKTLATLLEGDEPSIILWHILDAGWGGVSEQELRIRVNVATKPFEKTLQQFISQKKAILYDKENRRLIHPDVMEKLRNIILESLADYHQRFPLKTGMPKEELAAQLPRPVDVKLYNFLLRQLAEDEQLVQEMEWVRLATHKIDLTKDEEVIRQRVESEYLQAGLQPPFFREVTARLPGTPRQHQDVLEWMFSQGILIKVKEDLYFHRAALDSLKRRLMEFFKENEELSAPQFKEITQASRKYTIPLLEYFDTQKVTVRVGDVRRLRDTRAA
ncbi:selenocysteine-specific translation elongation factor [Desulfoferrobacter suflitae]|uniref:selenocysteine-specific translation elongation factor n=1 Tax=Desulfoferrobacter suflitae TaxID=2865782 RepID=UPI002164EF36|nr:selenocysteine-specific translation elongation factor [Desulfoferrobacter suflitae]MCK8601267.1 selenocysteine-specific translation elongation factor [Desulfoferrobacter suflitae]